MALNSNAFRLTLSLAIILLPLFFLGSCSDGPTESTLPRLVVSESSFNLTGAVDISGPSDQTVVITASNGSGITYSAVIKSTGTRTSPWLRLLNETGITPDTMILRFSIGSVNEGVFVDTILVSSTQSTNSPQMIEVRMNMRSVLTISDSYMDFISLSGSGNIDSQIVRVESNGSGPFDFTATTNRSWLSVSHPQGVGPVSLVVYVDPAGLIQGIDTGRVTIAADELFDSPRLVTVTLNVSAWAPQEAPLGQDLAGLYFLDENVGWAVGRIASVAEVTGYIVRTTDGGDTWELMASSLPQPLGTVEFVNSTTGWIIGGAGYVLKTLDGGATWNIQNTPAADDEIDLWDADFLDANTGWAVGAKGVIITTSNGGALWEYQESGTLVALSEVSFVDAQHGWAVGNAGTILYTSDGGQNWNSQDSPVAVDLNGVRALNLNEVWVVGKSGSILHTVDGGLTWTKETSPTTAILQTTFFINDQTGWIVGDDGVMLHTVNGGGSWAILRTGTGSWLRDIYFIDDSNGWVVGERGVILHTISGGI